VLEASRGKILHLSQATLRQRLVWWDLTPWRGREPSSLHAGEEGAATRGGRSQGEKKVVAREK
jgi:hypothetical protein